MSVQGCYSDADCSAIYNIDVLNNCYNCDINNNVLTCDCCEDESEYIKCRRTSSDDLYNERFKTNASLCTDGKTKIKNDNGSLKKIGDCITWKTWLSDHSTTIFIIVIIILIIVALSIIFFSKESKKKKLEADRLNQKKQLNEATEAFGLDSDGKPIIPDTYNERVDLTETLGKLRTLKENQPARYNFLKKTLTDNKIPIPDRRGGGAKRTKRGKGTKGSKGYKGSKGSKAKGGRY